MPEGVGVLEGVSDGVGVREGVGVNSRLVEPTVRMLAEKVDAQIFCAAEGTDESSTRRTKLAVDTGEDVVAVGPSSRAESRRPPAQLLPEFRGCVGATELLTPLASAHATRRTCDTGTPVVLAKEQRMPVMLESVRTVLPAPYTTLMTDWGGDEVAVVLVPVFSPTPRPIASAATRAMRRPHGRSATAGKCLPLSATASASAVDVGAGARRVRPVGERVVFFPAVMATGLCASLDAIMSGCAALHRWDWGKGRREEGHASR